MDTNPSLKLPVPLGTKTRYGTLVRINIYSNDRHYIFKDSEGYLTILESSEVEGKDYIL